MYKVLSFLENQIAQIENELNATKGEVVYSWTAGGRVCFLVKLTQRGRPAKSETNEE